MEKYIIWYYLQLKAFCKKKICWIQILVMCLVIAVTASISLPEKNNSAVGLANASGPYSAEIASLLTEGDSLFSFRIYESEERLQSDILAGNLECGFVFSDDFDKNIEKMQLNNGVKFIQTPFSTKGSVAQETFYTAFLQVYSGQILKDSISEVYGKTGEEGEEIGEELLLNNQEYLNGDNLFQIIRQEVETEGSSSQREDSRTYPLQGLVALFLFTVMFMQQGQKFNEERTAFRRALDKRGSHRFECLGYFAAVTPAATVGFVIILFSRESRGILMELGLLLLYLFVTCIWVFLIGRLFKNQASFMGWTATLLVTQLLICPVFTDLSVYVKALRYVRYVFPLGIYLSF